MLQEKCEDQEKTINILNEQIDQATGEADQLENIRGNLEGENNQLKEETEKAVSSRAQAAEAIIKLDEARNLLNKLLGNQGPFSQAERHKFLPQKNEPGAKIHAPSNQYASFSMQQHNNEYFAGNKQHGNQADNYGGEEDDFWYQTPKGVAHQSGYGAAYQ